MYHNYYLMQSKQSQIRFQVWYEEVSRECNTQRHARIWDTICQNITPTYSSVNRKYTRHNSADSVPTSNLVCVKEGAVRNTFSHIINIDGIIYYTCSLDIDNQCTGYKNAFKNIFKELCVKITLLRYIPEKILTVRNAVYSRLYIDPIHITPPVTAEGSIS